MIYFNRECKNSRWEAGTTESSLLLHQGNNKSKVQCQGISDDTYISDAVISTVRCSFPHPIQRSIPSTFSTTVLHPSQMVLFCHHHHYEGGGLQLPWWRFRVFVLGQHSHHNHFQCSHILFSLWPKMISEESGYELVQMDAMSREWENTNTIFSQLVDSCLRRSYPWTISVVNPPSSLFLIFIFSQRHKE